MYRYQCKIDQGKFWNLKAVIKLEPACVTMVNTEY